MTDETFPTSRFDPHLPYLLDGPISATMALVLIFASGPLTGIAGWSLPPAFLQALGAFLLSWSAFNLLLGATARPQPVFVWGNIVLDGTWILGSALLVALHWGDLTALGIALVLGQALAVAVIFAAKLTGVRALVG